jgi:mRNA interferase RelE/StbE
MKKYAIVFKPSAKKDLERMPKKERQSASARVDALADNPRPHWATMTTGDLRGVWKFRVGDYRVAYRIEDNRLVVLVVAAGDRKEIYDVIRRMRGRYGV